MNTRQRPGILQGEAVQLGQLLQKVEPCLTLVIRCVWWDESFGAHCQYCRVETKHPSCQPQGLYLCQGEVCQDVLQSCDPLQACHRLLVSSCFCMHRSFTRSGGSLMQAVTEAVTSRTAYLVRVLMRPSWLLRAPSRATGMARWRLIRSA